jgi:uncharacterized protein (DUF362 family)
MNIEMKQIQLLACLDESSDRAVKDCKLKTHTRCEKDTQKVKNALHFGQKNDTIWMYNLSFNTRNCAQGVGPLLHVLMYYIDGGRKQWH